MPRAKQHQSRQTYHHQYANQSPYHSRGSSSSSTNNDSSNGNHSKLKIFVGGLSGNITEDDFKNYFQNFGTITDVVVMYDNATHRPRGFGFITFDSEEAVENVLQNSFHNLNGRLVEAKRAVPKDVNNHSNNRNRANNNYNSRMMGARGPAFSNHPAGIFPPYIPRYGYFHGYVSPPPLYAFDGGYYGGYTVGSHGGIGYGGPIPGPWGFWNVQGLVASRRGPVPNTAMYPGYINGGFGGNFHGAAAFDDGKENQTCSDVQTPAVASTAPSQVESVKLEAQ